jgi:hypothetical protein
MGGAYHDPESVKNWPGRARPGGGWRQPKAAQRDERAVLTAHVPTTRVARERIAARDELVVKPTRSHAVRRSNRSNPHAGFR